jgi:hypothetical protein
LDIGDALLGHGRKSVGDNYGEFQVPALKRELEKIPTLEPNNSLGGKIGC